MMRAPAWPYVFVFAAGYEVREAIEFGNWKLAVMAAILLGLAVISHARVHEGSAK